MSGELIGLVKFILLFGIIAVVGIWQLRDVDRPGKKRPAEDEKTSR